MIVSGLFATESIQATFLIYPPVWKGGMDGMTDKERQDTKMATLYELRLIFSNGDKDQYTKEEILELLDKLAMAKDQQ